MNVIGRTKAEATPNKRLTLVKTLTISALVAMRSAATRVQI